MTLTANFCLTHFDSGKDCKFSTYFIRSCYCNTIRFWVRYESERKAVNYQLRIRDEEETKVTNENFAFHEAEYKLYRVPEDTDLELQALLEAFETLEEAWAFFTRTLNPKEKFILEKRFREDWTFEQIGNALSISKQRCQQIEPRAIQKVGERLKLVRSFAELFDARIQKEISEEA